VPDNESVLYVPLRSNAKTLVTGAAITALRRRLKYASVFHEHLVLESGLLRMQAGPGGSFSVVERFADPGQARWQTPRERHRAGQIPFQISIGKESTPGVLAETMHPVMTSDAEVSWTATLHPFASELPGGTDWVHFGRFSEPGEQVRHAAQEWTWADERNPYLDQAIPGRFVRSAVIKNANNDLALAAAAGYTITIDALHAQVVAQRFRDETAWKLQGYAIPFLFPQIGDWTWREIADLRRDPNMARFRAELRKIEEEAAAEASSGDLEAAAHHAYERHNAAAVPKLTGLGRAAGTIVAGYVISSGSGLVTLGVKGLGGDLVSAAVGSAPGAFMGIREVFRQRKSRGWVTVRNKIIGLVN
jgi:hypothetical protein